MVDETFSVVVQSWCDSADNALRVKVVRADTTEDVFLQPGIFVLRFVLDDSETVKRCSIRHVTSGREAYVQVGPKLHAFIKECLVVAVPLSEG